MTGDDISQCDREIAACADYDGPDLVGAAMGWADNMIEKELIIKSLIVNLPKNVSSKIIIPTNSGCWEWNAAKTNGYGVVQHNGRVQRAHRVVYECLIGPIADGLELDHLCCNRGCVNPHHLEPVTGTVNILRGNSMSARHARQTQCKRGHDLSVENVYLRKRGDKVERFCRACARIRDNARYARRSPATEVEGCKK